MALTRQRAQLDQLKSSAAYQAHEQLADLRRLVTQLHSALALATRQRDERAGARRRAEADLARAGARSAELAAARALGLRRRRGR